MVEIPSVKFSYGDCIEGIGGEPICLNWLLDWEWKLDSAANCCCLNCIWGCLALMALKVLPSMGKSDGFSILTWTSGLSLSISPPGRGVDAWRLRILSNCCWFCCCCCWKAKFCECIICCICGCICLCTYTLTRVIIYYRTCGIMLAENKIFKNIHESRAIE